jgi:hypothetical protein
LDIDCVLVLFCVALGVFILALERSFDPLPLSQTRFRKAFIVVEWKRLYKVVQVRKEEVDSLRNPVLR